MKRISVGRKVVVLKCLSRWVPWVVGVLIEVKEGVSAKYEIEQIVGVLVGWFIEQDLFVSLVCYLYLFRCGYAELRVLLTVAQQEAQQKLLLQIFSMGLGDTQILMMPERICEIKLDYFLQPVISDLNKIRNGYKNLLEIQKECR